ncbi:hypothetical protein KFE26_23215 [Shewanella sp. M16]|uniref:hypothetical protein n=1 Tax=Shewanella sp. M16 TaxID=2830837 RepID=UPI001BAEE34D|nr:hypothetical protein [Shewanella sp. M16]MBS0045160.1 hypothetical protein [Shewanella sp. M16]
MKKKLSRSKLKKWLKSAVGITLLSISINDDVSTVISNISSTSFLSKAMEQRIEAFPKGIYLIEYQRDDPEEDDDVPYNRTVWALAFDANLARGGKILNLSNLLSDVSDYEYFVSSNTDTGAYKLTSIVVKQPENPIELKELVTILNRHSSFVSIENGSGKITSANSFINGNQFI